MKQCLLSLSQLVWFLRRMLGGPWMDRSTAPRQEDHKKNQKKTNQKYQTVRVTLSLGICLFEALMMTIYNTGEEA